jgi:hypothetical protein
MDGASTGWRARTSESDSVGREPSPATERESTARLGARGTSRTQGRREARDRIRGSLSCVVAERVSDDVAVTAPTPVDPRRERGVPGDNVSRCCRSSEDVRAGRNEPESLARSQMVAGRLGPALAVSGPGAGGCWGMRWVARLGVPAGHDGSAQDGRRSRGRAGAPLLFGTATGSGGRRGGYRYTTGPWPVRLWDAACPGA